MIKKMLEKPPTPKYVSYQEWCLYYFDVLGDKWLEQLKKEIKSERNERPVRKG